MKSIPYSQIKILKKVASGGFGTIYQAIWSGKRKNQTVAIKKFSKSQDFNDFLNEKISYGKCCHCGCIIKCYGFTKDPESNDNMLVLKFAKENLHDYLQNNFSNITWKKKMEILLQVSIGLRSIHNADLIHRDFHSENILYVEPNKQCHNKHWQIGDLGLSQPANTYPRNNEIYGIIPNIAPEVFNGTNFSKASDVYSMGMIMWELTTGRKPFWNRSHDIELIIDIFDGLRPPIITNTPEGYIELMKECWHPDPRKRPTAADICERIKKIYDNERNSQYPTEITESSDIGPVKINNTGSICKSRPLSGMIQSAMFLRNSRSQSINLDQFYYDHKNNITSAVKKRAVSDLIEDNKYNGQNIKRRKLNDASYNLISPNRSGSTDIIWAESTLRC